LREDYAAAQENYTDLAEAEWAAGFIGAATKAGILDGYGNGIFDPNAEVTIEQLAKIMVLALDLPVDPEADVEGASDWAKGYVKAVLDAGLIDPQNDYKIPATREMLVQASFSTYEMSDDNPEIMVAAQSGVKRVKLAVKGFKAPESIHVSIERIGTNGERTSIGIESATWSGDGKIILVTLQDMAEPGIYEAVLTVDQSGETATMQYEVEPERLVTVELGGADTLPRAKGVEVPYILLNQYGEPWSRTPDKLEASFSEPGAHAGFAAGFASEQRAILADLAGWPADSVQVTLNVDGKIVSRTYLLGEEPVIQSIESGGFVNESGVSINRLGAGQTAWLVLRAYDQYGNLVTDLQRLNEGLRAEQNIQGYLYPPARKSLEQGPNGTTAVRVAWNAHPVDTTILVTVRSDSGDMYLAETILFLRDPWYSVPQPVSNPAPTVAVDPNAIFTMEDSPFKYNIYVPVTSTNADSLYYALISDSDPDVPTAADLIELKEFSGTRDNGTVSTSGQAVLELSADEGGAYKLYIVASSGGGQRVSSVLALDLETDSIGLFAIYALEDMQDPDRWLICLMHMPIDVSATVYYVITDDSHPFDMDSVVDYARDANAVHPDVNIVARGQVPWSRSGDQFDAGPRLPDIHYAYAVLELYGVRLMIDNTLELYD